MLPFTHLFALPPSLHRLQEAETSALARAEAQARAAAEAEAKAEKIAAAAAAAASGASAPPVVIEVVEKVVEVQVPAEGQEEAGGALGLLNSLGIVVGGGLGGYVLLQQGKAKKEKEEFEGALGAEQKLVAGLRQQAEGVRAALEKEQETVSKLKQQMQAQQSEASRLLDAEKRERAAAQRSVRVIVGGGLWGRGGGLRVSRGRWGQQAAGGGEARARHRSTLGGCWCGGRGVEGAGEHCASLDEG